MLKKMATSKLLTLINLSSNRTTSTFCVSAIVSATGHGSPRQTRSSLLVCASATPVITAQTHLTAAATTTVSYTGVREISTGFANHVNDKLVDIAKNRDVLDQELYSYITVGMPGLSLASARSQGAIAASMQDNEMKRNETTSCTGEVYGMATSEAVSCTSSPDDSYVHEGHVSLNASMQTTVPEPYDHDNKCPTHLNMPKGGILREKKYVSDEQQKVHPSRNFSTASVVYLGKEASGLKIDNVSIEHVEKPEGDKQVSSQHVVDATDSKSGHGAATGNPAVVLSQKEKFKRTIRDYGATVVVFHITISLISLGIAYVAVSSGLDVVGLLARAGIESSIVSGASTFVIAYAVHKMFVPARMAITITATPFIVHYLRRVGILKVPVHRP